MPAPCCAVWWHSGAKGLALDAAHKAAPAWGKTGPAERANILLKIADRIEENTEKQLTTIIEEYKK